MREFSWHKLRQQLWSILGGVSVRTKIFGIILGSSLLISLTLLLQAYNAFEREFEFRVREVGVSIARDIAARSTELILVHDLYGLYELISETRESFEDVRYVFILDSQGQVLVHTFESGFPVELLDINPVAPEEFQSTVLVDSGEEFIWDVAVPIFDGRVGTARVGVTNARTHAAALGLIGQMALTSLFFLALGLLASTLLTVVLTRPLKELVKAAGKIAKGDYSYRVQKWAEDEIGALAVAHSEMAEELSRMDSIRRDREELRRTFLERVISAQEEERKRIARELHDSTSQSLSSISFILRNLEANCQCASGPENFAQIHEVVLSTLEDVRKLAFQLRPAILDDLGLKAALDQLFSEWQDRTGIPVDAAIVGQNQRLNGVLETTIYRIIQECLSNVERHARATKVSVLIESGRDEIIVVVEDNGIGMRNPTPDHRQHLGLLGIRERVDLHGGSLLIETEEGQGTSIFVRIPHLVTAGEAT